MGTNNTFTEHAIRITPERSSVTSSSLPQVSSNPLATRMIAIFDEDGGGDVDFQEFVSGLSAFSSKGNKEEKLRFAFKVYDIDRDGYISNGELFIVLKMMVGSNLKDQQLQQIVDKTIMEADLDRDGKISFEEFTKMVENTDVSMSMTLGTIPLFPDWCRRLQSLLYGRSILTDCFPDQLRGIYLGAELCPSYLMPARRKDLDMGCLANSVRVGGHVARFGSVLLSRPNTCHCNPSWIEGLVQSHIVQVEKTHWLCEPGQHVTHSQLRVCATSKRPLG